MDTLQLQAHLSTGVKAIRYPSVGNMRTYRRQQSKAITKLPPEIVLPACQALAAEGENAFFIAAELAYHHRPTRAQTNRDDLENFAQHLEGWKTVDIFGACLSGPAMLEGRITQSTLEEWATSPNQWWRRAALVTNVLPARRATDQDTQTALTLCEQLVEDREDLIVKALSWVLRELAKKRPEAVATFLKDHDPKIAPRVKREVNNKLRTGLKSGNIRSPGGGP